MISSTLKIYQLFVKNINQNGENIPSKMKKLSSILVQVKC